jgi:carbamoyl-phosphate synthase large subunit
MKNVLITSSAAKVLLVQSFGAAAARFGARVFTADLSGDCATAYFSAHHLILPAVAEDPERFLDALERFCREQDIGLVVPTRDGELPLFARAKERFAAQGICLLVSSLPSIELCQDKVAFTNKLQESGIPVLPHLDPASPSLVPPLFLRPRQGAGGRGIREIHNERELSAIGSLQGYVVNRLVDRAIAKEYTIDVLMDFDGRPLQGVARRRDAVVAGEATISTVVDDDPLVQESLHLCQTLGLCGHNTVQAFRLEDGTMSFIEVNPRFGGASNLSIQAGLDSPARLLELLSGSEQARLPRRISIGARMYRYKQDIIVRPGGGNV